MMEGFNTISNTAHEYHLIDTPEALQQFIQAAMQQKEICFDTETTGTDAMRAEMVVPELQLEKDRRVLYSLQCR